MNYTTTEQSKKLVELGLNPDTADMAIVKDNTYCNALSAFNGVTLCQNYNEIKDKANYIPCWSLGALLNYIKDKCGYYEFVHIGRKTADGRDDTLSNVYRLSTDMYEVYEEGAINTCYQMIIKLHEQKFI